MSPVSIAAVKLGQDGGWLRRFDGPRCRRGLVAGRLWILIAAAAQPDLSSRSSCSSAE